MLKYGYYTQTRGKKTMLLQFSLSNFASFKDEKVFSTKANINDTEHDDILLEYKKDKYLPSVALYGANASGKSNFNRAITRAIMLVRSSHLKQVGEPTGIIPFLLDDESRNNKTSMNFVFVQNNTKYAYGFVCDSKRVYEEYLLQYKTAKPTLIFERTNVNEYTYTSQSIKKELKPCETKNSENMLFLSTATLWNAQSTKEAYKWFVEGVDTYDSSTMNANLIQYIDNNKDNEELKPFLLNVFKHADINVVDYTFKSSKADPEKVIIPNLGLNENAINQIKQNAKEYEFFTTHRVENNGMKKDYVFNYQFESTGTQTLLAYGVNILNALQTGKTMIIDELETSLHPMLVKYIIDLFNNPEINKNNAQIIFTTHETELLDLGLFRRDQIYFTEKDERGTTDLYSLAEYSPRKDENIRKGYMQGRYGAIPFIVNGLEW